MPIRYISFSTCSHTVVVGSRDDLNPTTPAFPVPQHTPNFGTNRNTPFLFQSPTPQTSHSHPWAPPPAFSPTKAFPQPQFQDLKDVDMSELSPPKQEILDSPEEKRVVATGALRRVYKSRERARSKSRLAVRRHSDGESESESDDEGRSLTPVTQNTSNHYTLNIPSVPAPKSDTPYILLGYVFIPSFCSTTKAVCRYLQFFFNLSLVLVFLYLVIQFILTVQRDVEQRISEYSMDIVQEISMCASQYKNNLCASNPIPAMIHQCATWETCMSRDPTIVGRAKVGAEMIAEVVNGFVEPISWKTLVSASTSNNIMWKRS